MTAERTNPGQSAERGSVGSLTPVVTRTVIAVCVILAIAAVLIAGGFWARAAVQGSLEGEKDEPTPPSPSDIKLDAPGPDNTVQKLGPTDVPPQPPSSIKPNPDPSRPPEP